MASIYDDLFEAPVRRHTFAGDPGLNRSTRSWTNNGVHYTAETASYARPGFSFSITGSSGARNGNGSISTPVQPQQPRRQGTGLIGTAFNLIGTVLAAQQAHSAPQPNRRTSRQTDRGGPAYGAGYSNEPQTLFSNFPGMPSPGPEQSRRRGSARTQSPQRGQHKDEPQRSRSYRKEDQRSSRTNPRSAYVEDSTDEDDESLVEALEKDIKHHQREATKCRQRIQQVSQQRTASTEALQKLLDELKKHEKAYEDTRETLKSLKAGRPNGSHHSDRSNQRRGSSAAEAASSDESSQDDFDHYFSSAPHNPNFNNRSPVDDWNAFPETPFSAFQSFFNDFGPGSNFGASMPQFFAAPGAPFNRGPQPQARPTPHNRPQPPPQAGFVPFRPPQPAPPAHLLKPEEAERLFKTYNERWNGLGPTDPNIPYPARNLHANGLLSRDSIWAPNVNTLITQWSEEAVMQANAQAFYLGVVGLSPQYTEALGTGRIVIGFNKSKAGPAQVKELIDLLKKEKGRWHSDRLGRRNAGGEGVNERLQRDEKARAVFHAVCELMEAAQCA